MRSCITKPKNKSHTLDGYQMVPIAQLQIYRTELGPLSPTRRAEKREGESCLRMGLKSSIKTS